MPAHPWDRKKGESETAHAALMEWLQLGSERSIDGAARNLGRNPKTFRVWRSRWSWDDRALAWDAHFQRVHTGALERMTVKTVRQWQGRFDRSDEQRYRFARELKRKALMIAQTPLQEVETNEEQGRDGRVVTVTNVYQPVPAVELERAGKIFKMACDIEDQVRERVLPRPAAPHLGHSAAAQAPQAPPQQPPPPEQVSLEARVKAQRELEQWRSDMRLKLVQIPTSPPGEGPGTEDLPASRTG